MARVKIKSSKNSRTHETLPDEWSLAQMYDAVEFDNTHYKLFTFNSEGEALRLMWPIEDLEIIQPATCEEEAKFRSVSSFVLAAQAGMPEKRRIVHNGTNQQQVAKTKIASTGDSTDYYKIPAWATELRHLIQHKNMNFDVGNIFKASYRLGEKEGIDHEYDLMKIIFFAQSELERIRREKA